MHDGTRAGRRGRASRSSCPMRRRRSPSPRSRPTRRIARGSSVRRPGHPLRLFRRVAGPAPQWAEVPLPADPFTDPAAATRRASTASGRSAAARRRSPRWPTHALGRRRSSRSARPPRPGRCHPSRVARSAERVESWCASARATIRSTRCSPRRRGTAASRGPVTAPGRASSRTRCGRAGTSAAGRARFSRFGGRRSCGAPAAGRRSRPAARSAPRTAAGWAGRCRSAPLNAPERLRQWPLALRSPLLAVAPAPGSRSGDLAAGVVAAGLGRRDRAVHARSGLGARVPAQRERQRRAAQPARGRLAGARPRACRGRRRRALDVARRHRPVGARSGSAGRVHRRRDGGGVRPVRPAARVHRRQAGLHPALRQDVDRGAAAAGVRRMPGSRRSRSPGDEAIAVSDAGVLVNDGGGWKADPGLRDLLGTLGPDAGAQLTIAAGLPDGGAVIGGRDIVVERDRAGGAWRFADQPLPGQTVVAAAAVRAGARVRAIVAVQPRLLWPQPDVPVEADPNSPTPILPSYPPPGDGYVVRETATGWADDQRTAFGGTGLDRPVKSDPVLAFALDAAGTGWAVGGWTGQPDSAGRGIAGGGSAGAAARATVATAGVYRYDAAGAAAPPANEFDSPVPLAAGPVRLAIGAHAQCAGRCADLANQEIAPDRILGRRSTRPRRSPAGPTARAPSCTPAAGSTPHPEPPAIRRRSPVTRSCSRRGRHCRCSARSRRGTSRARARTRSRPRSRARRRRSASAGAAGSRTAGIPGAAPDRARGRTTPSTPPATGSTVRVVVIDNAAGSLAASDPAPEPRRAAGAVADRGPRRARAPAGSPPSSSAAATSTPGAPGTERRAGRRSRRAAARRPRRLGLLLRPPEENRAGRIPAAARSPSPRSGPARSGTARPSRTPRASASRTRSSGTAGSCCAEITASARDPQTNRAPVTVRLIPVIDGISMQALDGALLRRSRPALFQGLLRKPLAGDRWAVSRRRRRAEPVGRRPVHDRAGRSRACRRRARRASRPEYAFQSADPDILDFVQPDAASTNLRKPLLGADDKVITAAASGPRLPVQRRARRPSPSAPAAAGTPSACRCSRGPSSVRAARGRSSPDKDPDPRRRHRRPRRAAAPAAPPARRCCRPSCRRHRRRSLPRAPSARPRRGPGAVVRGPARGGAQARRGPAGLAAAAAARRSSRIRSRPAGRPCASTRRSARRRSRPSSRRPTPSPTAPTTTCRSSRSSSASPSSRRSRA